MRTYWLALMVMLTGFKAYSEQWIVKNPQPQTITPKNVRVVRALDLDGDRYWIVRSEANVSSAMLRQTFQAEDVSPDLPIELIESKDNELKVMGNWYVRAMKYEEVAHLPNGRGVIVAVLDTGIDSTHSHLADRMWINKGEIPNNGIDDDRNGYIDDIHGWNFAEGNKDSSDFHGHGTHCAGLVAAKPEKYARVQGVAQGAQVMALRIFGYDNGPVFFSQAAEAMKYAVDHGAKVLSNSWRVLRSDPNFKVDEKKVALLRSAIEYAGRRGAVVVVASGNEGKNIDRESDSIYPAGFQGLDNLVVVTASDQFGSRASGSNYGNLVDVAAPGADITSTLPDESWGSKTGTSMATPIIAGAVARALSAGQTPANAIENIVATSDRSSWQGVIRGGLLNLGNYLGSASVLASVPAQPTESSHPGSSVYPYTSTYETFKVNGRTIDVFLPTGNTTGRLPVVIYGHGQALGLSSYRLTFEHLARKGVAVIFPQYDTGFFDQDWRRMADDFNNLTKAALDKYPMLKGPLVYSGHSKGAYIALMAAGAPKNTLRPASLVLFAPAGYDQQYLAQMDPTIPLTLVWGDSDTIIKQEAVREIYSRSPAKYKQFILAVSYSQTQPRLPADHFFPLTKAGTFGGRDGVSPHHYYGAWAWMLGAVQDAEAKNPINNEFIYGVRASETGLDGLSHQISRSW